MCPGAFGKGKAQGLLVAQLAQIQRLALLCGDVLSTALTRDFDGSCAPTTVREIRVLYYAGSFQQATSDDKSTKGKRTIGLQKVANNAEDEASTEDTVDWPKVSNRRTSMQQMWSSIRECLHDEQSPATSSSKAY